MVTTLHVQSNSQQNKRHDTQDSFTANALQCCALRCQVASHVLAWFSVAKNGSKSGHSSINKLFISVSHLPYHTVGTQMWSTHIHQSWDSPDSLPCLQSAYPSAEWRHGRDRSHVDQRPSFQCLIPSHVQPSVFPVSDSNSRTITQRI